MKLGLRARIALIASAVVVFAVVAVTVAASLDLADDYSRALDGRSAAVAKSLRLQLERVLQYGIKIDDLAGFEEQCIETVRTYEGISSAFVATPDGNVLFHNDPSRLGRVLHDEGLLKALATPQEAVVTGVFRGESYRVTVVPVLVRGGEHVASVVVTFPSDHVRDEIVEVALYGAAVGALVLLLGIPVLLAGLGRFVTRPLSRVANAVERVGREGGDFSERVEGGGPGEIGLLIDGFNRMVGQLQARDGQLVAARDEAQAASRAKSQFLATMSHEIRTPMNGVLGMTELLLRSDLSAKQRRFADAAHRSGRALLSIIDDILDFSKVEAGKLELESIEFDLREAVEDAVGLVAELAQRKHLEIACSVGDEVPAVVRGDPGRLRQVLTNLLSNAVKFTERGEIVLAVRAAPRGRLSFSVADTGIGIAPEVQAQLFRPFRQADSSTSRRFGGSGLGLAIAKQLVELMGGEMSVESVPGSGSTFSFAVNLPAVHAQKVGEHGLAGRSILIIEDNPTNRTILIEQAIGWGMRADSTDDGAQALVILRAAAARGAAFDFALIDMKLPGMDGDALVRAIKAEPALAALHMVVLTSLAGSLDADRARGTGVPWLTKPVRRADLYASLSGGGIESLRCKAPAASPARTVRLLLAEDNPMNQEIILAMLEDRGYDIAIAENGVQALEISARGSFDAVLMDCQMPQMDGFEATRRLREREAQEGGPRLPIIALTANAIHGDRERCLDAGMDDYLSKPVSADALLGALERWTRPGATPQAADRAPPPAAPEALDAQVVDLKAINELRKLQRPGRPDIIGRMLELFGRDAPRLLEEMRAARGSNDVEALRRTAHTLKSTSASLGARRLSAACKEIERLARAGDVAGAGALVDAAGTDLAESLGALERLKVAA